MLYPRFECRALLLRVLLNQEKRIWREDSNLTYIMAGFGYTSTFTSLCFLASFFFPSAWIVTSHGLIVQETKFTVHGSHGTIHTLKNYFVTVFSVFNFSKNKLYPNRLLKLIMIRFLFFSPFSFVVQVSAATAQLYWGMLTAKKPEPCPKLHYKS